VVREDDERQLAEDLVMFEELARGIPVYPLLRDLSEEVAARHFALAEGVAALSHGRLTAAGEALMNLSAALLEQDLVTALVAGPKAPT